MRRILLSFLITLFFATSPVLAATQDCEIGETRYRPGNPEEDDDCAQTSPQKPHTEIDNYPLTCIPASSIKYTQTTKDPNTIPSQVIVDLTVDLSQAQLGGFGPSQSAIDFNTPDQLAQQYLFNALFDKPVSVKDITPDRESFRTYWRLLTSYQQATAKAIYLDQAKPHLANQIIKVLPQFAVDTNIIPITKVIIEQIKNPEITPNSVKEIIKAINNTFTLKIDFSDVWTAIQNDEIYLNSQLNNSLITYTNSKGEESTIFTKDLAKELDKLGGLYPGCLRTIPVCKNYQKRYLNLDPNTKAAYDSLLPFNFDNTQGYLVLDNNVVEENIPFLKAIDQGLNERHTGLMYTLSPSWMQPDIKDQLIKFKSGNLSTKKITDYINNLEDNKANKYLCSSTPSELLGYFDAPKTYPNSSTLNQSITFDNLEQTSKKQIDTEQYCQGEGQYGYYCSTYTTQSTCQSSSLDCTWVSKPIYEYTYTAKGKGDPIIVLNSPLVTNITNSIVSGATSLWNMLLPSYAQKPDKKLIDAPTSDFTASSSQPNSSVSVTTSDGSNTMPIYRESNLAQDALCLLQNKWLIPAGLQRSSVCSEDPTNEMTSSCQEFDGKNTSPFPVSANVYSNPVQFSSEAKQLFQQAASCFKVSPKIIAAISTVEVGSLYANSFDRQTEAYCAPSGDGCGSWGPFQFLHNKNGTINETVKQRNLRDPIHPFCFDINKCQRPEAEEYDVWAPYGDAYNECNNSTEDTNICSLVDSAYAVAKKITLNISNKDPYSDATMKAAIFNYNSGACGENSNYTRLGNMNYCDYGVWFNQNYDNNLNYIGN